MCYGPSFALRNSSIGTKRQDFAANSLGESHEKDGDDDHALGHYRRGRLVVNLFADITRDGAGYVVVAEDQQQAQRMIEQLGGTRGLDVMVTQAGTTCRLASGLRPCPAP